MKKSDGIPAIYRGEPYLPNLPRAKYPKIETGERGVAIKRHPWEVEKDPERPLGFYPSSWGYIYFFPVKREDIETTLEKTT